MLTTRELALEAIHVNAAAFGDHTRALRAGDDDRVHHVHQARVATRRLRAAIKLFHDLLPESAATLRDELKWIAGLLGGVRDLDVQVQRLETNAESLQLCEPLQPYAAWLKAERDRAARSLAAALEEDRFARLSGALDAASDWQPPQPADDEPSQELTADQDGPERIRAAIKPLRKRVKKLDEPAGHDALHRIRITAKRARYTVEFFEIAFGDPATELKQRLARIQEVLGGLQDTVVSCERIDEALARGGAAWPPRTVYALGRLAQAEIRIGETAQARFPKSYRRARTAWKRFADEIPS